jgi:hypothetical protein
MERAYVSHVRSAATSGDRDWGLAGFEQAEEHMLPVTNSYYRLRTVTNSLLIYEQAECFLSLYLSP